MIIGGQCRGCKPYWDMPSSAFVCQTPWVALSEPTRAKCWCPAPRVRVHLTEDSGPVS
jgi:hypothetical protein